MFLGHENIIWRRRPPPTSNHIYRRLFDNACTRELEYFLAQVNSHCTINSLRRILRPSDHALLGGVVLPSYIQLGNEAVHQLTVGNARDTVLYYLADSSRGGGQDIAPEPTMGRDLEALLCLLLDLKSLDQITFALERMNFIDEVSKTMNHNPCSPWGTVTRLRSKRQRPMSPIPEKKTARCEGINTSMGVAPKVQAWADKLKNGATVEHSQTPAIPLFSVHGDTIKWTSINKPIPSESGFGYRTGKEAQAPPPGQCPSPPAFFQPLPNPPAESMFQSRHPLASVPELHPQDSSQHTGHTLPHQPLLASRKSHGLKYTTAMGTPRIEPEPEPHVTDLLLHTLEISMKQKQLDECKSVLIQLMQLCEELSKNPMVIPRDVIQHFLQDIASGLIRAGVFPEKVSDKGSKKPAAPSIPGPIRRGPVMRSQAATTRATPVRDITDPLEGGPGAGLAKHSVHDLTSIAEVDCRLAMMNPHQFAAPEPSTSPAHTQPRNMPQVSLIS